MLDNLGDGIKSIDGEDMVVAWVIAIVPAAVAYFELVMATRIGSIWFFLLPFVGFIWFLYRHDRHRNKAGAMLFYLAIMAFLLPITMLSSTFLFASGQSTGFDQFGAAVAGGVLVIVFAIIGLFAGIVLYLISKRVIVDTPDETEMSG